MKRRDLLCRLGGALAVGGTTAFAGCSSSEPPQGTYIEPDGTVNGGSTTGSGTTRTTPEAIWSAFRFEHWELVETDGGRAAVKFTVVNATDEHNAVTFVFYVGLLPAPTATTGTDGAPSNTTETIGTASTTATTETSTSAITTTGTAVCDTKGGKRTVEAPYVVARKRVSLDGGESGTFRAVFPLSWETFYSRLDSLCTTRKNLAHPP